jgi:hypothetical protein
MGQEEVHPQSGGDDGAVTFAKSRNTGGHRGRKGWRNPRFPRRSRVSVRERTRSRSPPEECIVENRSPSNSAALTSSPPGSLLYVSSPSSAIVANSLIDRPIRPTQPLSDLRQGKLLSLIAAAAVKAVHGP